MFLEIVLIVNVIIIIALIVRYLYVQAHILSSKEFRKTAERQSLKIRAKDPKITCNYCGCIINTAKEKRCPNCGAVYGDDEEIKQRFDVDEAAVEKKAAAAADDAVARAHEKALESLRYIKIAIIALVCVFIVTCIYAAFSIRKSPSPTFAHHYQEDEELQDSSYTEYVLLDSPELVIFDKDGVTLKLMNVYADSRNGEHESGSRKFRIAFSLVNTRNEDIRFSLKCEGVNGRSNSRDMFYISNAMRKGADVHFYENIYGEWIDSVDEIVIGTRSLMGETSGTIYESEEMEVFDLTGKDYTPITADADMGSVIFENDNIRIRSLAKEKTDRGYDVWIENLSDHNYYIKTSDFKVDGAVPGSSYVLYDSGLPAGYTLHHDSVMCLGDTFANRSADAVVELSFSFSDPEDPSNDFSTGYITLE